MEKKICIHCFVSGKVQGVWFRASAQDEASARGLTGWARNLPDGRVEVMACGEKEPLMEFYQWLQKGPEQAEVAQVSFEEINWQNFDRFSVK